MHCISLTPRWSTISAIFCRFVCVLRPNHSSFTQMLYFYILIHYWRIFPPRFVGFWSSAVYLFPILFAPIISQNCRHYNVLPISCPINATSLSSCVFRLQNLIELHSRIVSIKNWKMYSFLKDINYPQNIEDQSCRCMLQNNLKVTRNLREKSSWATWQGGWIFSRNVGLYSSVYKPTFRENIHAPLSSSPRGFFAKIARDFQIILKHAPATLILNVLWVVYIFQKGVHLSIFYWDYSGMKLY